PYTTLFRSPGRVDDLPRRDLAQVARHDAVNQPRRIPSRDAVLEERRDVYQRRGVADGVVLVLVVGFVRADGVVARPVAVAQALAERERSLVECCSDWHAGVSSVECHERVIVTASDYMYAGDSSSSFK